MPTYKITSPDGRVFKVTAPEGATQEEVLSYAQSNYKQPQEAKTPESTLAEMDAQRPYTLNVAGLDTGVKIPAGAAHFLAGAGKGMTDLARGAGQMLGLSSPQDEAQARELDAPLMSSTGANVGRVAGQVAAALPVGLVPGANTYAGATAVGGLLGALQPVTQNESRGTNTAIGMAGGAGGRWIGDKAISMLRGRMPQASAQATGGASGATASANGTATVTGKGGGYNFGHVGEDSSAGLNVTRAEMARRGKEMGFQLTPGQASGSKALQQLEAKLSSQPMTSGRFNAISDHNQAVVNRATAGAIGETENVVDSSVLAKAHDRLSRAFESVADDTARPIDTDGVLNKLASIEDKFEGLSTISENGLVKRFIGMLEKGEATGRQLTDLSSKLGKAANQQMTSGMGDRQAGMALYGVKDTIDDLISSGLSGEEAAAFSAARGQYRNFITVAKSPGVVNPATGDVSGRSLGNVLARKDFKGYTLGKNQSPMYDAARFSKMFGPIVGDSGTATRSPLPSPTDFVLSLPFNLATRAYTSGPVVNAAARMGGIADSGISPQMAGLLGPIQRYLAGPVGASGLLGVTK